MWRGPREQADTKRVFGLRRLEGCERLDSWGRKFRVRVFPGKIPILQ